MRDPAGFANLVLCCASIKARGGGGGGGGVGEVGRERKEKRGIRGGREVLKATCFSRRVVNRALDSADHVC